MAGEEPKSATGLAVVGVLLAFGGLALGMKNAEDDAGTFQWQTFGAIFGPFLVAGCVLLAASYIISAIARR